MIVQNTNKQFAIPLPFFKNEVNVYVALIKGVVFLGVISYSVEKNYLYNNIFSPF